MFKTIISRLAGLALVVGIMGPIASSVPAAAQDNNLLNQVMQRGTIRIAIIGGNKPYSSIDPSGYPEGYDIDIANEIAKALGVKAEFITTDIPGRIVSLQSGKADLTIADFTRTVERSKAIAFTDPYLVVGLQFAVQASRNDLKTVDDLNKSNVKIGITRGGTTEATVPLVAPTAGISGFDNVNDTLLALQSNQVDAMTQDNLYNAELLKDHPGQYKVLPGLYSREEIAIGLPAGQFDWYRVINTWIEQFNATGENKRLFKKWFGFDLPANQNAL
jgi:polar amino acid transport system substrate-binding protein